MRHKIFALMACLGLVLSLSACTGMDGIPDGLPTIGSPITDIGNPNEEEELIKGLYINDVFDVTISYSDEWTVTERGYEEAIFSSESDESMTASFVRLGDDESLEDFILDVRGSIDDLVEQDSSAFDRVLCAAETERSEVEMDVVECYHFNADPDNRFVMVFSGYAFSDSEVPEVVSRSRDENYKGQSKDVYKGFIPPEDMDHGERSSSRRKQIYSASQGERSAPSSRSR